MARLGHSRARRHALHLRPMKQRASKKRQTKKVKAAKAKAKAARRAAAAAEGDKDGDVGMDVAAADEDVMIAEAEPRLSPKDAPRTPSGSRPVARSRRSSAP